MTASQSTYPILGQVGGGTVNEEGIIFGHGGTAFYSGTAQLPSQTAVVGYGHRLNVFIGYRVDVEIYRRDTLVGEHPTQEYLGHSVAVVQEANDAGRFHDLIACLLNEFPGVSGQRREASVHFLLSPRIHP